MAGPSFLLLLACGGILVQVDASSDVNSNSNTNILIRSSPTSTNTDESESDEPDAATEKPFPVVELSRLEKLRRKLYEENDRNTAAVASAAADAALSISEPLIQSLRESIAIGVAETVAEVLKKQTTQTEQNRRSLNYNVNTNLIEQDFSNPRESQRGKELHELEQDFDLARGSGGSPISRGFDFGSNSRDRKPGRRHRDPEDEVDAEEDDNERATQNSEPDIDEPEEEKGALTSKPSSSHELNHLKPQASRRNLNSNANAENSRFSFRNFKRFNSRPYNDGNEDNNDEKLKPTSNHKSILNNFQRMDDTSLKSNRFTRDLNRNANRKIQRGFRYHRD